MFNSTLPTVLHVDLNSCFATVEQQANPLLRGKPVVVAAYTSPGGCILAASIEAKRLGIVTGMRVGDAQARCRTLIVLSSDPGKYRFVNQKLTALLSHYTDNVEVRSIDEMVFNARHYIASSVHATVRDSMISLAGQIKQRIRTEIGEWLTVSIGISTNRYLAKIASGLHKPDGLDVICAENIEKTLAGMELEDLCGIKAGYGGRLRQHGIATPIAMYHASSSQLKTAFSSKIGHDWWLWLHGYESDFFDRNEVKSIGHSYALYIPYMPKDVKLHQIVCQLVEKVGRRLRKRDLKAEGVHISCVYTDYGHWNHGEKLQRTLFQSSDIYKEAMRILGKAPQRPVRILSVTCFSLSDLHQEQLSMLGPTARALDLTKALDTISNRWGECTVFPGRMLGMQKRILDRIAFGSAAS